MSDPSIADRERGANNRRARSAHTRMSTFARAIEFWIIRKRWLSFFAYLIERFRKNISRMPPMKIMTSRAGRNALTGMYRGTAVAPRWARESATSPELAAISPAAVHALNLRMRRN